MSVEAKIQELLVRANESKQLIEEKSLDEASETAVAADGKLTANTTKDTSKSGQGSGQGDATQPMQGSSKKADFDEVSDATGKNSVAAKASKEANPLPMKGDAKSVKTQASEEVEVEEEDVIAEEDISTQLNLIFGEDLSEEFKARASSIFEAAVIARVNSEMDSVTTRLEEQTAVQLLEFKETLVEKVNGYLNYVVEQWMEENQLAVESGLRTEVAEDFIEGLKTLFQEHYIDVPAEKYDVMAEMQAASSDLTGKLDEAITLNIELAKELSELKRTQVFEEGTKDLAATEVEKLKKLVEGVEFDSEELYKEKVAVIKENFFPKTSSKSPEQVLVEESGTSPAFEDSSTINRYAQAISRSVKSR